MSGAVVFVVVGAVAGYWWFARPNVTSAAAANNTEQAIGSEPGAEGRHADATGGWRVVESFTGAVQHPAAAGDVPDGQTAIIPPRDSLALEWMAGDFYNGEGPDVRIVGPEGTPVRYTIYARTSPSDQWTRFDLNTRGFVGGETAHDFGHHDIGSAREVLIRNEGTGNLEVDAIMPLYTKPQAHVEEGHGHEGGR